MKFTNVEFARKFNLGNFETQDIKLSADIEEDEDVAKVIEALKQKALEHSQR